MKKSVSQSKKWRDILKPYYGKYCRMDKIFTYEAGLFFYAFDAEKEKTFCETIISDCIGSWRYMVEICSIPKENIVIFGVCVVDDPGPEFDEKTEESYEARQIFFKKGFDGIKNANFGYPTPLFYDISNGNAYFVPEEFHPLSKDGEKNKTIDKLKITIIK